MAGGQRHFANRGVLRSEDPSGNFGNGRPNAFSIANANPDSERHSIAHRTGIRYVGYVGFG